MITYYLWKINEGYLKNEAQMHLFLCDIIAVKKSLYTDVNPYPEATSLE
jgi:hypothetical protein